ncbi:MAG: hypothetical protein DRN95_08320 [Candidatus Hydrothermarchaeota archaeon]|nr:MAG: hypothetical protein DRN95_08320 [Candidatus Hydrothermarchaeota archaeon]
MEWKKDVRTVALLVLLLISLTIIFYPFFLKPNGVRVISVSEDSPCKDVITVGSIITEVAGIPIKNSQDFAKATRNLKGSTTFIINDNPRRCSIPEGSQLGVTVSDIKKGGIRMGTDIGGGIVYFFKPEDTSKTTLEKTLKSLESRTRKYGLNDVEIELFNNSFKILIPSDEESYIHFLTEKGELEGCLVIPVEFTNEEGEFYLDGKTYDVYLEDGSISINGLIYSPGDSFELNGIEIKVQNVSKNTTTLLAKIFDERGLTLSNKRVMKQSGAYIFLIYTTLSEDTSKTFARVTKGQEAIVSPSGEALLKTPLLVLIDETPFLSLPISEKNAGIEIKELTLWGFRRRAEDATNDMIRLSSIIEVKRLPTKLNLIKKDIFLPKSSHFFITLPLYTILFLSLGLSVFFFIRYKRRGVMILPLILTTLGELVLILGVISFSPFLILLFIVGMSLSLLKNEIVDLKIWIGIFSIFMIVLGILLTKLTVDSNSLIAFSIFTCLSMIQSTVIGDRLLKKKETHIQSEYKRLLRILWFSASLIAIVLLPLFFFFNEFRCFVSVLITGCLVSATLTKPSYWILLGKILKS